jgi:hypothetical protein
MVASGSKVTHARMAGWEGTVTPNQRGNWISLMGTDMDVWVVWHSGINGNGVLPVAGWYDISYLHVSNVPTASETSERGK